MRRLIVFASIACLITAAIRVSPVKAQGVNASSDAQRAGARAPRFLFDFTDRLEGSGDKRSPVLLIHGDDDRNVPFVQSIVMAAALRERGVEVEELVLPNEVHSFLRHASWLRTIQAAADFFDRKLKNRPPFQTSATNSHSSDPITEH